MFRTGYRCPFPCSKRFRAVNQLQNHRNQVPACKTRWLALLIQKAKQRILDKSGSGIRVSASPENLPEDMMDWEPEFYVEPDDTNYASSEPVESQASFNAGTPTMYMEYEQDLNQDDSYLPDAKLGAEELFEDAARVYDQEDSFYEFLLAEQKKIGKGNVYYPFSCYMEFELALFLNDSGLSLASIDRFLKLQYVILFLISYNLLIFNVITRFGKILLRTLMARP